MSRVLVISPHPDDESIGCGGTLRRHVVEGDTVHVVFLTSGEKGGHGRSPEDTLRLREQEAKAAADILGLDQIEFWREPDGALRATREVANRLREKLEEWKPELLYVTHGGEMHPDHRAAIRLVRHALARPTAAATKPTVLMFEVWTPMQQMDHIENITPYVGAKLAAIRAYKSQCEVMRFDQAALGLSRYRGEMHSGWPSATYAEIFVELRL